LPAVGDGKRKNSFLQKHESGHYMSIDDLNQLGFGKVAAFVSAFIIIAGIGWQSARIISSLEGENLRQQAEIARNVAQNERQDQQIERLVNTINEVNRTVLVIDSNVGRLIRELEAN